MTAGVEQKNRVPTTVSFRGAKRRGNLLVLRTNLQHSTRRLPRPDGLAMTVVIFSWQQPIKLGNHLVWSAEACHPPYRNMETAASEMLAAVKNVSNQYAERIIATGRAVLLD